ncbi:uncharacterized protein H6S33_001963 [Morchella sextelata]|uniref:uncharacterized protein n=1 Tax=Morchella sextelata TaxID=1174677 RepID=UPI001D05865F|nr:uncharacterized protein H6S33_001963 [Morchella sextelata]KAH0607911.1 hypothetical protein H6S33_001963 [Morchella sextelata]
MNSMHATLNIGILRLRHRRHKRHSRKSKGKKKRDPLVGRTMNDSLKDQKWEDHRLKNGMIFFRVSLNFIQRSDGCPQSAAENGKGNHVRETIDSMKLLKAFP